MKAYIVKKSKTQGNGLFATRNIKRGELILRCDIRKLKSYSEKEVQRNPKLQSQHCDYIGHNRYVMDFSPASYINHSCDPNVYVKNRSIKVKDYYSFRDIKKGEEITVDYAAGAADQINAKNPWVLYCKCGSKSCRKKITGDFFKLPIKLQRIYYAYLPPSIKRGYKKQLDKIRLL